MRNVVAKLPKRSGLPDEVKAAYWAALDEATDSVDAERRYANWLPNWSGHIQAQRAA